MKTLTYARARASLAKIINAVCENHEPVVITKKGDKAAVLLSFDDYQSIEETAYLLRSPKNARRLLDSINEIDAGGGMEKKLQE